MALLLHKKFFSHLRRFVLSGSRLIELERGSRIWAIRVLPTQHCSVWLTRRLLPITCYLMNTPRHVSVLRYVNFCSVLCANLLSFSSSAMKVKNEAKNSMITRKLLYSFRNDGGRLLRFVFRLHKNHFAPHLTCEVIEKETYFISIWHFWTPCWLSIHLLKKSDINVCRQQLGTSRVKKSCLSCFHLLIHLEAYKS